jgi:hypothetical protein
MGLQFQTRTSDRKIVKTARFSGIYLALARTLRAVGFAFALAFLFELSSPGLSMANDTAKFSDLQIALDDDEMTAGRKASLIRSLNEKELQAFVVEMAKVFPTKTSFEAGQALRTIEALRRHKSFTKSDAKALVTSLAKQKTETSFDGRIRAMRIRLMAVSGDLNKSLLDQELSFLSESNRPSADRLAVIGALTDAMTEIGQKPSAEILEKLLANDVYEIRIHAADWFRLSLPLPAAERIKFLKTAIRVSPFQARERAYRALLSSEDKEFLAIYKAVAGPGSGSEGTGINCALDSNEKTRKLCQDAEAKALMLEKGKAK